MIAEEITIDWDEGGCYLHVDGETWRVADPEQLYDRVKAAIGPWLREREDAFAAFRAEASAGVFRCDPDESGGLRWRATDDPEYSEEERQELERTVAMREDGSLRMEPDEEPDDWRERLAGNADWSRKVAKGE